MSTKSATALRLSGPHTHICWTPDYTPEKDRYLVSLVRESDLALLIEDRKRLIAHLQALEDHLKRGAPASEGKQLRAQQQALLAKLETR